jgi:hypothetical protein
MIAAMSRFNDELREAGVLLMAKGLKPSSQGKRVAFESTDRTPLDGPYPQAALRSTTRTA